MRTFFATFVLVMSVCSVVQAKSICFDLNEGTRYSSLTPNFDGSVTVFEPEVLVEGDYALLSADGNPSNSVCKALGFGVGVSYNYSSASIGDRIVRLDSAGKINSSAFVAVNVGPYKVTQVICRK